MENLQYLNLSNNDLSTIPDEIGFLTNIGVINLRYNKIEILPESIGNCESLKVLDIAGNSLVWLPKSLTRIKLKAIWLDENQSNPLPSLFDFNDNLTLTPALSCDLLPQMKRTVSVDEEENENWSHETTILLNSTYNQLIKEVDLL